MLPELEHLRTILKWHISDRERQGYDVTGLEDQLTALPASYDAMVSFAHALNDLPLRSGWSYFEPHNWEDIQNECAHNRSPDPIATIDLDIACSRAETGFLAAVCGCMLGKPLEIDPTLYDLEKIYTGIGEWPIDNYVSEHARPHIAEVFSKRPPAGQDYHSSWINCTRERIVATAPDDDINYILTGLLLIERHGIEFSRRQLLEVWLERLTLSLTFGSERRLLIRGAMASYFPEDHPPFEFWSGYMNPGEERCGAVIRADAYGYACPGRPALAAELAWRDASCTHRRTGVYGSMFVAALLSCVAVIDDWYESVLIALKYVPQRSRFTGAARDCLSIVSSSADWRQAYDRIHARYGQYRHCQIYQEIGTVINTLRFATDIGDGICKQVMQGADTDSFCCTAGSILGMKFGPGYLEERWIKPFNDDLRTGMAQFFDRSLKSVAARCGALPRRVAKELGT